MITSAMQLPASVRNSEQLRDTITERRQVRFTEAAGVTAAAPELTAQEIDAICDALLTSATHLRTLPVSRIIAAVDAATSLLLDRLDRIAPLVAAFTGYSVEMARNVITRAAEDWRAPVLASLVEAEFGTAAVLEGFATPDGAVVPDHAPVRVHAFAPHLGLHVFSGNVPGVSVTSIIRALLVRSAVLGKPAAGEPVLAAEFARALEEADPEVGGAVAIVYWKGGDEMREAATLRRVGLIVHYGSGTAVQSLKLRAPAHALFVDHGPRVSVAVARATDDSTQRGRIAADVAHAAAIFDQQGCVSPQVLYVIGSSEQASAMAGDIAEAMQAVEATLPRGRISSSDAAAIRRARTQAEFASYAGNGDELWEGESLAWTVIRSADPTFEGSCLNRTVIVKHAPDIGAVIRHLAPLASLLQTAGLAGFGEAERRVFATRLAEAGVTRVTSIRAMPWPPATWHHDGRGPLRELVRWVDLED